MKSTLTEEPPGLKSWTIAGREVGFEKLVEVPEQIGFANSKQAGYRDIDRGGAQTFRELSEVFRPRQRRGIDLRRRPECGHRRDEPTQ